MQDLQEIISISFEHKDHLTQQELQAAKEAVARVLSLLDQGTIRVAEKINDAWHVNQWIKQAILLSFRLHSSTPIEAGYTTFFDKCALKYTGYTPERFEASGVRVVPPAHARYGCFIAKNSILMPSYVNIGAYIDEGTMVDTWATVGSCAQIGKHVHLSGGVGIGGVLEPLQANPTIIEDHCFIGARSEIVEGVIVRSHSVISMGVFIGQSTPIYNRMTDSITYGEIPPGSVVIPGNLPSKDGKYSRYCALIMKQVDERTRSKTSINDLLRGE